MNTQLLYKTLLDASILGSTGTISFALNGIQTIIKDTSIVGNVIQEWLKVFMQANNISYRIKNNTQDFADFLMNPTRNDIDLLEVKCFKKSPNFDVANFVAYARSLLVNPYRLDSDYLIIEYTENGNGIIAIKNIWLKKVWEICSASERSPLKIQWKQGQAVNIRPAIWYSSKTKYPTFNNRKDFVKAIKTVIDISPTMNNIQKDWFKRVSEIYKIQTDNDL